MHELEIPPQLEGDTKAIELARVWWADNMSHASLRMGGPNTTRDRALAEIDEWGVVLGGMVRLLAQGYGRYEVDETETLVRLKAHFIEALREIDPIMAGRHHDEH
jgi:hypothetical protein